MSTSKRRFDPPRDPLIPQRLLLLVTASALPAALVAFLTWHASHGEPWSTAIAAMGTFAGALKQLNEWSPP